MPSSLVALTMAFDKLFCSIKSNKSSRKSIGSHQQQAGTRQQGELIQQTENNEGQHRLHSTTSNNDTIENSNKDQPLRYVREAHHASDSDELSVEPGDVVVYMNSDNSTGEDWSYVVRINTNIEQMAQTKMMGYVPSYVLTTKPTGIKHCIKPKKRHSVSENRTTIDLHQHSGPHSHKTHCTSERTCHSNGCSIKLQQPDHIRVIPAHHQFDLITNSAQGSSGCQTFRNYPDIPPHFSLYYNVNASQAVYDCQPFQYLPEPYDAFVLHNFVPRQENDLYVSPGERVLVLNKDDVDWYWVRRLCDNREGFVPSRFMAPAQDVNSVMLHKGNSTATMKSSNQNDFHTYINQPAERKSLPTDQQSTANL